MLGRESVINQVLKLFFLNKKKTTNELEHYTVLNLDLYLRCRISLEQSTGLMTSTRWARYASLRAIQTKNDDDIKKN